ncbi:MAG: tetratricopeptide repeat protein, partial [Crocosphaera sp.]
MNIFNRLKSLFNPNSQPSPPIAVETETLSDVDYENALMTILAAGEEKTDEVTVGWIKGELIIQDIKQDDLAEWLETKEWQENSENHQKWAKILQILAKIPHGKLGNVARSLGKSFQDSEGNSDDYEAWYNRGIALDDLGRYEEAIASYDKALEIKPDKDEAWNNRGVALYNLGRYEDAIASYDKALEFKPDDHEAWNNRGIALYN